MHKLPAAILLFVLATTGDVKAIQSEKDNSVPDNSQAKGTVCVLPNSAEPPTRVSPGGMYNSATLTVKIDKRPAISWPHENSVRIENLTLNQRHLLVLTSDGKRIQSLWFRFSEYKDNKLCVSFDGYQGVQLEDKHSALWCKCK